MPRNSTLMIITSAHALSNYLNVTHKRPALLFILVNSPEQTQHQRKQRGHMSASRATQFLQEQILLSVSAVKPH